MKIVVSGGAGFVGAALMGRLLAAGHEVLRLVRGAAVGSGDIVGQGDLVGPGEVAWDSVSGRIDKAKLEGADAVVHLAGESISQGRWTAAKKQRIRSSRVDATQRLCAALAALTVPPKVLLCASAVGYYGSRGGEILDEAGSVGEGFLAEVCRDWEAATERAAHFGIRTASLRFGIVLSPHGGALRKMLPAFRFGLGGPMGNGRQYVSWITLDDAVAAIEHVLFTPALAGPINLTSPNPVMQRDFAAALGHVLHRSACLPMPGWLLKVLLGEMAESLLLSGARVVPGRLLRCGFVFGDPTLDAALARLLVG